MKILSKNFNEVFMGKRMSLREILYDIIHNNKPGKSVSELADIIGCGSNMLYRSCLPEDSESGVKFDIQKLIPLMKATNDYRPIFYIAASCGFSVFKVPAYKDDKNEHDNLVGEFQKTTAEAGSQLIDFFKDQTIEKLVQTDAAMSKVIEETVKNKQYCKKVAKGQLEMFDEF